ncbi:probable envelope ADP,ATP carrier protein, chloroplastic [Ananas comosus]|uniref:Probable envelope ADP,ATP carrier protein, chloroplastic n=1 Tax=Ananas comosus TaxID=4615 RepID=A0A6P5GBJ4_ANACO|nr:probable envelope ADP,ATP carrier protein, chloroplastic [Ananas comosus]
MSGGSEGVVQWRPIPIPIPLPLPPPSAVITSEGGSGGASLPSFSLASLTAGGGGGGGGGGGVGEKESEVAPLPPPPPPLPSPQQLLRHPLALLALVPNSVALFSAGAISGAAAKTLTAPLDRVKLLMQTHSLRAAQGGGKKGFGFVEAITMIGKDEGIKGYWKGNLPQVIRIIPYSAVQLFSYEVYKKLFRKKDGELSVLGRLVAGACAGMTSTLVTYPLDVLRLRLAVEPGSRTMSQVALNMLREEGLASFYGGLGPSLIGIAPYIAVNFCMFDLVKKSLPERYQRRPETSLATALVSATLATLMCYPLDTVRRQMQMKGSPYNTILDAFPGIVERDGLIGLYRGFVPNALKTLPNSSIKLTAFDTVKGLISAGQKELEKITQENQEKVVS